MIIKQLELSNFKTIKSFKKDFTGDVYLVTGENEVGKSTLLEVIARLLTGKRDDVLTNGEEKGFAKAIIGDDGKNYNVELKFTKANPRGTLLISDEDGMRTDKVSSFQRIFGYQDFDATEFVLWSKTTEGRRKQVEMIKSMLPQKTQKQIAAFDTDISILFDKRTNANSQVTVYANLLKAKPEPTNDELKTFTKHIDTTELSSQVADAVKLQEQYKGVEQRYEERKNRKAEIPNEKITLETEHRAEIDEIGSGLKRAKDVYDAEVKRLQDLGETHIVNYNKKVSVLDDEDLEIEGKQLTADTWMEENKPEKTEDIEAKIQDAETHNEKCKEVSEYLEAKINLDDAKEKSDGLGAQLTAKREGRELAIKNGKLPVDGLTFTDDGLFLNGIPFENGKVATSEEMEVAAKLIIAKNPKTKVFRVARGESLGSAKLKALVAFAKKNGYQGFIEEVVRGQNEMVVSEYTEK